MTSMRSNVRRITPKGAAKIRKAQKDFGTIFEEVKPFIKKRRTLNISTTGQWKVVSFE